ncbi:hypothetical protein PI126_g22411 [Phytophthora idaei]|nr:hypothetical protein PI126_g22411 [Phytophthora idaei]
MSDRRSHEATTARATQGYQTADAEAIPNACISPETRKKYASNLNVIKEWIHDHLSKEESNTNRFFDGSGDINLFEFTPGYFEEFLVYKRRGARTVTLRGYRSAIKDLYRLKRIALPVEYGYDMKQLFSGMKRLEAGLNQSSTPKTSGKQPLTYSLYNELCESTLTLRDSGSSRLFLVSQWNLMCRSISVQTLRTQHVLGKMTA